jgi:cysteinyl-tRNA synthetase
MAKSLNNGIQVLQLFSGEHQLLTRGFGADVLRFFVLQAHYRSTLDFSEEALIASEKGLQRLYAAEKLLSGLKVSNSSSVEFSDLKVAIEAALSDDLNTPIAIAQLFELARRINLVNDGKESIDIDNLNMAKELFDHVFHEILGIKAAIEENSGVLDGVVELLIQLRAQAKTEKNYALSDQIRNELKSRGIELMDSKEGTNWKLS